jgi:TolB-like protein
MAVEPAERFPDMAALAAALRASQGEGLSGRVRRRLTLAAVLLAVVAALAGAWLATRAGPRVVAPGAEAIAVLPFNASGAGVEFLREGMVDLLATNLQGVGGIRTVDPRAVLRRWGGRKQAGDGLDQALSVGRDLGAQSVVVGSAVSTGGRVRLAADLYSLKGERIGRAQVDGPADSVLPLVDRLSVALLRDVWRSREPVPSVRIAALTTDSLEALRAFLRGERYYRNLTFDSALAAYSRAVEVDSTFALAHLRRALVYGWTGGYGSKDSRAASAAAQRFASRLTDRDRALLAAYRVFDTGKPAAVDTMRAFLTHYPGDDDGWYLLGEAMFHTRQFAPVPPETVTAAFDSVLRRDSTLEPALLHPIELAVTYRDSAEFFRHFWMMEHTAGVRESDINVGRAAGQLIWGPAPSDSALRGALAQQGHPVMFAAGSFYRSESATSDTISRLFARISALVPATADVRARVLESRAFTLAGLGRVSEVRPLADSLAKLDRNRYAGVLGWPMALGLAPAGFDRGAVDSIVRAMPPGMWPEFAEAIGDLGRGQVAEARRHIAAGLELRDTTPMGPFLRGLLMATRGWAGLVAGDTTGGIRDLRAGLEQAAAPGAGGPTAFLRFQLALALSSRPATRAEGISWLRYAFDTDVLYIPLTYLALGRAYEAAGVRDSAAFAYGRFIHLWDKADPPLVGRVREAREALTRLTAEH